MKKIVFLRHGESEWNLKNKFTGWEDVDLSKNGIKEAKEAGKLIKDSGIKFNISFCSVLKRAIRTMWLVLDVLDLMWVPQNYSWKLNERNYGSLQGLNKAETAKKYGEKQTLIWRRSFDTRPPDLDKADYERILKDSKYKNLKENDFPRSECLKDTYNRVVPYWNEFIFKSLNFNDNILVVSHGNTIRAMVKHLNDLSPEEVLKLNIPTGQPLVYEFNTDFKSTKNYYLGDALKIREAEKKIIHQLKKS